MKVFLSCLLAFCVTVARAQTGTRDFDTLFSAPRAHAKEAANPDLKTSAFGRFFLGRNYRDEWTTPVQAPIINLKNDLGGLEVDKLGGGKQTHSLHLKDQKDRKVFLRSVKKYPANALPEELRSTIAEVMVKSGLSASYPYGVLSVGPLSNAAGVPWYKNKLTYLTPGSGIKDKYKEFTNEIYLLELRETFRNGESVKDYDTYEMDRKLQKSGKNQVDEIALLRNRLLDNFMMDFDRHEGQFDWAKNDSAGFTFYYPLPKDRDQVFFKSEGLLPSLLSKMKAFHQLQGLHAETEHVASFNFAARNLDRAFLPSLDRNTWSREIDRFLAAMTDSVIDEAMRQQPKEIRSQGASDIAQTLKGKRKFFKKDLLNYYEALSERVTVTGSNKRNFFDVANHADGTTEVTVREEAEDGDSTFQTYHRVFYPGETKEVQLFGLEGDDRFTVRGEASEIRVRLIGGPGEDEFITEGKGGKVWVYDVSYEHNKIQTKDVHLRLSADPLNNEYRRLGYNFNTTSPRIAADYSNDGGLFLGPAIVIVHHGFRKEPYDSRQSASVSRAINSSSYELKYDGEFIKAIGTQDLLVQFKLYLPTSRTRFYGYGNETVNAFSGKEGQFYLASYTLGNLSVLARHTISPWLQLNYGPTAQFLRLGDERNLGKYISTVMPAGEGEAGLAAGKWYAGGMVALNADARNDKVITTRGARAGLYAKRLQDLSAHTGGFTEVGGELSLYTDFLMKNHIVLATSFGAAHNAGNFSFPQAQYLGFKENLRGFRMQRFAGHSRAYNNTELRINFGMLNLYLLKGPFGVLGFHDIGRVWSDHEHSTTWHRGYGGGIWMAPFNTVVLSGVVTYSKEEKNFVNLNIGFKF